MLREEEVNKAVSFLEHPQVKPTAGQRKVDFLRRKGLTDEEIREAFQRAGQTYPEDTFSGNSEGAKLDSSTKMATAPETVPKSNAPNEITPSQKLPQDSLGKVDSTNVPSNPMALSQPGGVWIPQPFAYVTPQAGNTQQIQQQKERSWSFGNIFLGAGATAGIILAIRELLKKYVVPLYFPEARLQNKQKISREDDERKQYMETQVDELKTLVKDLVKATERNNDMVQELIHHSERQARQDLFEVVNSLKSLVSGIHALKDTLHLEVTHSEDTRRKDNASFRKGREEDSDLNKSGKEVWHTNTNWLVGEGNYSLDASDIGTQIFSNKTRDPGIMDDFMSIPPASVEELVPKTQEISSSSKVNDVHYTKKEGQEEENHNITMNGTQVTNENIPNGTLEHSSLQTLDEENAKKAFQQAMLAEARAALQRRSHPHSSSRSSPARSIDSERQTTDKEPKRDSESIRVDSV